MGLGRVVAWDVARGREALDVVQGVQLEVGAAEHREQEEAALRAVEQVVEQRRRWLGLGLGLALALGSALGLGLG